MAMKVGIVGQGCAGMSVAYHLLRNANARNAPLRLELDVIDAHPLGYGATGVAAGLLHPLAPSGKPLWQGMASYEKAAALVRDAGDGFWRSTGLYRPASTDKQRRQFERNIGWEPRDALLGARCTEPDGGFYIPQGMVVDTKRYLEALWDRCSGLAEEHGSTISARRARIESLDDLQAYDATVIAAGAAVQEIAELRDAMTLDLCQGYTVELVRRRDYAPTGRSEARNDADTYASSTSSAAAVASPSSSPSAPSSILGQPYVAFHSSQRAIVGATQRHGVSSAEAFDVISRGLDDPSEPAAEAADSLVRAARDVAPALTDGAWDVRAVRCGVRAIPQRTELGSIPYGGKVDGRNCWVIAGLGARGLVYHAVMGELTAAALLDGLDNEAAFAARGFGQTLRWLKSR